MRIRRTAPFAGWYAVLALAVVAALGASTVVGAGLSLWRGSTSQRVLGATSEPILRPGSAVVTVPAQPAARPHKARIATPVAPAVSVAAVGPRHVAVVVKAAPRPSTPTRVHRPTVAVPVTQPFHGLPVPVVVRPTGLLAQAHVFFTRHRTAASVLVLFAHPARVGVHLIVVPASVVPQLDTERQQVEHDKAEHDKAEHDKAEHAKADCDQAARDQAARDQAEHDAQDSDRD